MSRKILLLIIAILGTLLLIHWCGGNDYSSVESLYGTYQGVDNNGRRVKIVLKSESDNEWRKYGEDRSDDLVYKDSNGTVKDMECQTITWTWNLPEGYVQTYYHGNERTIIDVKGGKMYYYWGEYLDKRNGFSFTKR